MSKTRFYKVWSRVKDRCLNPNSIEWKDYGGRGIKLYKPWENYLKFYDDMFHHYKPGLYLDRMNNDGHYEPRNCRWVTNKVNNRNKRTNVRYRGKTIIEWSEIWNISFHSAKLRIKKLSNPDKPW